MCVYVYIHVSYHVAIADQPGTLNTDKMLTNMSASRGCISLHAILPDMLSTFSESMEGKSFKHSSHSGHAS
jgi:hypothetical protein